MTLYEMNRLETMRRVSNEESERLHKLSNLIYDGLEGFGMAEQRRDDLSRVMIETATKFLEKGL